MAINIQYAAYQYCLVNEDSDFVVVVVVFAAVFVVVCFLGYFFLLFLTLHNGEFVVILGLPYFGKIRFG